MKKLIDLFKRNPDVIIGGADDPYLLRWHIIPRNKFFNIYLHKFCRPDDDRALHDHPWASCSIILRGYYYEHLPGRVIRIRRAGNITLRRASQSHRIGLSHCFYNSDRSSFGEVGGMYNHAWTLFLTGPKVREWGFHCPQGWRHWKIFTDESGNKTGRGCD